MAIEFKDYYKILGITRGAGDEEIRRAFRKLARQYHPDITGNDRTAEDKFKELNEAYEVLSDPERRRRYDDFSVHTPPGWEQFATGSAPGRHGGKSQHFTFTGTGFSEFFDQLFGADASRAFDAGPKVKPQKPPQDKSDDGRGDDLETDLAVSFEEVARGTVRPISMRRAVRCRTCYGMGQYNAHSCESCAGSGNVLRTDTFKVKIPAGIAEGALLRVPRQGEEGVHGVEPGDLYLKIRYARHPEFQMEKGQLVYDLELAPWEAVLGATVSVPTLTGRVNLKVPPGTQNGAKLRVRGRGIPAGDGGPGDLIVKVKVQVPPAAREREVHLWQELARECSFHPRDN